MTLSTQQLQAWGACAALAGISLYNIASPILEGLSGRPSAEAGSVQRLAQVASLVVGLGGIVNAGRLNSLLIRAGTYPRGWGDYGVVLGGIAGAGIGVAMSSVIEKGALILGFNRTVVPFANLCARTLSSFPLGGLGAVTATSLLERGAACWRSWRGYAR